jgi:hypothetical protein
MFHQILKKAETSSDALRPYKNALTCVTCHDPHVSVKVTGKEIFNNACKNCHSPASKNGLCTEKKEIRNKCRIIAFLSHASFRFIDIPHVTVHDHFIRKPLKKAEVDKVKEFIVLYAVNEKSPSDLTKAKAYIQQYDKFDYNPVFLDSAKKYIGDKTNEEIIRNFETLVHLYFIKREYKKIFDYVKRIGRDKVLNTILVKKSWDK